MVACHTGIVGSIPLLYLATSIVPADSGVSDLQFIHRLVANSVSVVYPSAHLKLLGISGSVYMLTFTHYYSSS